LLQKLIQEKVCKDDDIATCKQIATDSGKAFIDQFIISIRDRKMEENRKELQRAR